MSAPSSPGGVGLNGFVGAVDCPICTTRIDWEQAPLVTADTDDTLVPLNLAGVPDGPNRTRLLMHAYRRCPGNDVQRPHILPERYPGFRTVPITIGLIGAAGTGKSHLLAAMVSRLQDVTLMARLGLRVQGLDLRLHAQYIDSQVSPFIDGRAQLSATPQNTPVEFAVGLVIDNDRTGRSHTVVVFDMSGERLQRTDRETAFINQLSGLICVVDPQAVRGLVHPQTGGNNGDRAFDVTLDRLRKARCAPGDHFIPIPSVTVVGKSDLLTRRGYDELRPWLPHGGQEDLDLHTVEAESRDLYAFLYSRGGGRWLGPAQECADSTLHLASATGGPARLLGSGSDAVASFPRESFRQQRVLRPLMSLLALTGVLDRSEITGPEHVGGRP